ncbi:amino acid deaminase [Vibrio vulnificus]|nr:amino acid deaminase [Vibrio vulnificus]
MKKTHENHDRNYHNFVVQRPAAGEKSQVIQPQACHLSLDEVSLPSAVIHASALNNNLKWMQQFANHHQVKLAPHGKTSMTPDFFRKQLEHGAWGITVATAAQAEIAAMAGAKNIIIANQLVGKANMAIIGRLIEDPEIQLYCCVDSSRNIRALSHFFAQRQQTLHLFIELGVDGGRCGCRSEAQVFSLANEIHSLPHLALAGIEVYEGVIHGDNAEAEIRHFLQGAISLTRELNRAQLIASQPIITGAGSAWYDVVAEQFSGLTDLTPVIRPGCYAIHDTGIYQTTQQQVMQRARQNQGIACDLGGDLLSALELWAHVISRPEPTRLVVGMGKRDVAFDAGLPTLELAFRDGQPLPIPAGVTSTAIMDQHTFVEIPAECELDVGDILVFSTSHPCLTIDKWRALAIRDEHYQVSHWVETRF